MTKLPKIVSVLGLLPQWWFTGSNWPVCGWNRFSVIPFLLPTKQYSSKVLSPALILNQFGYVFSLPLVHLLFRRWRVSTRHTQMEIWAIAWNWRNSLTNVISRLFFRAIQPRLTIYVSLDATSYHAVYLHSITTKELVKKLFKIPGIFDASNSSGMNGSDNNIYSSWGKSLSLSLSSFLDNLNKMCFSGLQSKYSASGSNLYESSKLSIYINGPNGVHVLVNDEVLNNIKDESLFTLDYQNGKVLMKAVYKNEMN